MLEISIKLNPFYDFAQKQLKKYKKYKKKEKLYHLGNLSKIRNRGKALSKDIKEISKDEVRFEEGIEDYNQEDIF